MDAQYKTVLIGEIRESATNPRRHFDERELKELTESIRAKGVIVPLLLRQVNSHLEIVAGARRFRAAKAAGLDTVPAEIRALSDEEAVEIQTVENLQRQDVHPLDEAAGYQQMLKKPDIDVSTLASRIGKSPKYVQQRLALNNLTADSKTALWKDEITLAHALMLAKLQPSDQKFLMKGAGRMTVHDLQDKIQREVLCNLDAVGFDKKSAELVQEAGACTSCPKRSGYNRELFSDITTKDRCLDPACFNAKIEAHLKMVEKEAAARKVTLIRISMDDYCRKPGVTKKAYSWDRSSEGWRDPKSGCPNVRQAIVVDGGVIGNVKRVCVDPGCKTCNPAYREQSQDRTRKMTPGGRYKRRMEIWNNKVEQLTRQKTYEKLLPLINPVLGREHLVMLVRELHMRNHGPTEDVTKLLGLKLKIYDRWRVHYIKEWNATLSKATEKQLAQLVFGLLLQQELINDPSMHAPDRGCLDTLVRIHGKRKVDVKAIEANARKAMESKKPKPPKAQEPKPKKSGKTKKSKTRKEGK